MPLRGVKRRWITLLRHNSCRNGSHSDRRSKGWKMGSCWGRSSGKAVEKVSQSGGGRGGSRRAACQKPAQGNWAGKQTLICGRCSLQQQWGNTDPSCCKHTQFLLSPHTPEPFQQQGSDESLAPECPGQHRAGTAIRSISWKIIIEAPWILSRKTAKPQFM